MSVSHTQARPDEECCLSRLFRIVRSMYEMRCEIKKKRRMAKEAMQLESLQITAPLSNDLPVNSHQGCD